VGVKVIDVPTDLASISCPPHVIGVRASAGVRNENSLLMVLPPLDVPPAEVVTADGKVLIADACTNADLFWALKGGGGGSFGVVSKVTLRVRELPEFWGGATFTTDDAFRRVLRQFDSSTTSNRCPIELDVMHILTRRSQNSWPLIS
jgi:hypothetical protein